MSSNIIRKGSSGIVTGLDFEVQTIRKDFPTLESDEVYLDSAASSLTPVPVVEAMNEYYYKYRASVNRGSYKSSQLATDKYEEACEKIAGFFGADSDELVITSNATNAVNALSLSMDLKPGDEIIISVVEHGANMLPWLRLVNAQGVKIRWFDPVSSGRFNIEEFVGMLTPRTRLISFTYISNVLGTVFPVHEIARVCRERGIWFCLDACQAAPHVKIDVKELGCDFMVFSGHKMLGPTGVGGLYIKRELQDIITPAVLGSGSTENSACPGLEACGTGDMPRPSWVVAGTPPIAEVLGLGRAIDYIENIGLQRIHDYDQLLVARALDGLQGIEGIRLFGSSVADERSSIVSFNVGTLENFEVGRMLDEKFGISVRSGTHCALGFFMENQAPEEVYGNVRASFYFYNTLEEVDQFVEAVTSIAEICL